MYHYAYVIVETRTICRVDVRAESRLEDEKKSRKEENGRLRVNGFLARGDLVRAVPVRDARPGTSSAPR